MYFSIFCVLMFLFIIWALLLGIIGPRGGIIGLSSDFAATHLMGRLAAGAWHALAPGEFPARSCMRHRMIGLEHSLFYEKGDSYSLAKGVLYTAQPKKKLSQSTIT